MWEGLISKQKPGGSGTTPNTDKIEIWGQRDFLRPKGGFWELCVGERELITGAPHWRSDIFWGADPGGRLGFFQFASGGP